MCISWCTGDPYGEDRSTGVLFRAIDGRVFPGILRLMHVVSFEPRFDALFEQCRFARVLHLQYDDCSLFGRTGSMECCLYHGSVFAMSWYLHDVQFSGITGICNIS